MDRLTNALAAQPCRTLARPLMRGRATVFLLHREHREADGIYGHSADELRRAVRALRASGCRFCSIRELVESARTSGTFPPDAVAFTMDDGFADQGRLARVLLSEGVPVTIFLITGLLDGKLWPWDDRVSWAVRHSPRPEVLIQLPGREWRTTLGPFAAERRDAARALRGLLKSMPHGDLEATLSTVFTQLDVEVPALPPETFAPLPWDEARRLEEEGVDFGPHSVTHRIVSRLDEVEVRREIEASRARLRDELRRPLNVYAWPTGRPSDFTPRDQGIARELGFDAALATGDDYMNLGVPGDPTALFGLKRFALPTSPAMAVRYASWLERARQLISSPFSAARA